ncbi:MAG: hypothetical protein WCO52_03915 [bacterium]
MAARYSHKSGYTVTRRAPARRQAVRTVQRRVKFGPTTAKFLGLAVLAILAVVMLTQSSTNATSAYKQTAVRTQISQSQQDIEQLQLEAKRAQSLQTVQQSPIKDQMTPTTQVDYVEKGTVAGVSTEKP